MLQALEKIYDLTVRESGLKNLIRAEVSHEIQKGGKEYPLYSFEIGSADPTAPVLFLVGGVHGLERIGSQLAWSLLKTTIDRLLWDENLNSVFKRIRLVCIPLLNPYGYVHFSRSNPNGVDLMRNSRIQSTEKTPFLLGGHRISNKLPWFQGEKGILEKELLFLERVFRRTTQASRNIVSVDFHSGFGMVDRLWFPFSYSQLKFTQVAELHALVTLFEQTHPYHIYRIEPQSEGYLLSGDIWDQLYLDALAKDPQKVFIPLTLEMGSWNWVRKNPLQIFSKQGIFNPMKEHRIKRTYRRHHLLFDFLLKAVYSHDAWTQPDQHSRLRHEILATDRWY